MFSILIWLIFGFIVGSLAKWIHPGDDPIGFLPTVGIGVAGSFIGGLIHSLISGRLQLLEPAGLAWSVVGGVLFCYAYSHYNSKNDV